MDCFRDPERLFDEPVFAGEVAVVGREQYDRVLQLTSGFEMLYDATDLLVDEGDEAVIVRDDLFEVLIVAISIDFTPVTVLSGLGFRLAPGFQLRW